MRNNKFGFVLIILLLIVFIPAGAYGIYYSGVLKREDNNPQHLAKKDGKLYYYNGNQLVCSYKCINPDCHDAISGMDDAKYYEDEFIGTEVGNTGRYIFIQDGDYIKMVPTNGANSLSQLDLKMIKNYDGRIGRYLILIAEGDYGYKLYDKEAGMILFQDFDYIGVNRNYDTENFITMKDGQYYVTDINGSNVTNPTSLRITDFDNNYTIYYDDDYQTYEMVTKDNKTRVPDILKYSVHDTFTVIQNAENITVYTKDLNTKLDTKEGNDITFGVEENIVLYFNHDKNIGKYSVDGGSVLADEEDETKNKNNSGEVQENLNTDENTTSENKEETPETPTDNPSSDTEV